MHLSVDNFLNKGVVKGGYPPYVNTGGSQRSVLGNHEVPWERTKALHLKAEWHEMLLFFSYEFSGKYFIRELNCIKRTPDKWRRSHMDKPMVLGQNLILIKNVGVDKFLNRQMLWRGL